MLEGLGVLFLCALLGGAIAGMTWIAYSIIELKEKVDRYYQYQRHDQEYHWKLVDRVGKLERNAVSGVDPTKSPNPVASSNTSS